MLPSPSKSPIAAEIGTGPEANWVMKYPGIVPPLPIMTVTAFAAPDVTRRSGAAVPPNSAMWTDVGFGATANQSALSMIRPGLVR